MTSLPTAFVHGPSQVTVRDALASCQFHFSSNSSLLNLSLDRRSQYLAAGSSIISTSDSKGKFEEHGTGSGERPLVDEFLWDDLEADPYPARQSSLPPPRGTQTINVPNVRDRSNHESTPLLRKAISFYDTPHPRHFSNSLKADDKSNRVSPSVIGSQYQSTGQQHVTLSPTDSTVRHNYGGKSTFGQTVKL